MLYPGRFILVESVYVRFPSVKNKNFSIEGKIPKIFASLGFEANFGKIPFFSQSLCHDQDKSIQIIAFEGGSHMKSEVSAF